MQVPMYYISSIAYAGIYVVKPVLKQPLKNYKK